MVPIHRRPIGALAGSVLLLGALVSAALLIHCGSPLPTTGDGAETGLAASGAGDPPSEDEGAPSVDELDPFGGPDADDCGVPPEGEDGRSDEEIIACLLGLDSDGDGPSKEEIIAALLSLDSDGDGTSDGEELANDTDPFDPTEGGDIDGDGIENGEDPDVDGDGIENGEDPDVDGDGIENIYDDDIDGDGLFNWDDDDDDGDGIPDEVDEDEDDDDGCGEHGYYHHPIRSCVCDVPGWRGEKCDESHCDDVSDCGGEKHGTCIGPNTCNCKGGWQAQGDCSVPDCAVDISICDIGIQDDCDYGECNPTQGCIFRVRDCVDPREECIGGVCRAPCDDENPCRGVGEFCGERGHCLESCQSLLECNDDDECTDDKCTANLCVYTLKECPNANERCSYGECRTGCVDDNPDYGCGGGGRTCRDNMCFDTCEPGQGDCDTEAGYVCYEGICIDEDYAPDDDDDEEPAND